MSIILNAEYFDTLNPTGFRDAFYAKEDFHFLNVPRLGTYTVYDELGCTLKCLRKPSCLSLNMGASKGANEKLWCELLPSNKYINPEGYRENGSSHHVYIEVGPKGVLFKRSSDGIYGRI